LPNSQGGVHPLSFICDCLFSTFAAPLHILLSSPSATQGHDMPCHVMVTVAHLTRSHLLWEKHVNSGLNLLLENKNM